MVVVGLGPAGPDLVPDAARAVFGGAARRFVRTARHPAVAALGDVETFDGLYETATTFDEVYATIVGTLLDAASSESGPVAYAVPGSPYVAERTVELLRDAAGARGVAVDVVPALSFLDLVWDRLGVDPVAAGVRIVDGTDFAAGAAGERGPLLVAQCHSRRVLSDIKLAVDGGPDRVVLLHHLGLGDEEVVEVPWSELDRSLEPDHLTSLWIPLLAAPVAAELVRLEELVRVLRARCPWDMAQTHGSLARHLLEEAHETLDAIDEVAEGEPDPPPAAVEHLEEELGDLLFQVAFHAVLAAEAGRFTLADVARVVHDKLVGRHPHVFGDARADTPEEVAARWEVIKREEKGRASVFEGIPASLPALALAAKLQRKAESLGVPSPSLGERLDEIGRGVDRLGADRSAEPVGASGETLDASAEDRLLVGQMLFALADAARRAGVDPEAALRSEAKRFRQRFEPNE